MGEKTLQPGKRPVNAEAFMAWAKCMQVSDFSGALDALASVRGNR